MGFCVSLWGTSTSTCIHRLHRLTVFLNRFHSFLSTCPCQCFFPGVPSDLARWHWGDAARQGSGFMSKTLACAILSYPAHLVILIIFSTIFIVIIISAWHRATKWTPDQRHFTTDDDDDDYDDNDEGNDVDGVKRRNVHLIWAPLCIGWLSSLCFHFVSIHIIISLLPC